MKKAKFKYYLKNNDLVTCFDSNGYYYEDKKVLVFNEDNGTQVFVDMNNLLLTRENTEMLLVIDFNNGNSFVQMKQMGKKIEMPTQITHKKLESNRFMANYTLSENNNFEFMIEWFLGGE
ncbi:MAG: hypothetical protein IJO43_04405 [Bacilli bacterium]|nr:hypothetical protein [Bacilli bacterium]